MVDLRRVTDAWRGLPVTVRDLPLAVLVAVLSLVPALENQSTQVGDLPRRPTDGLAVVAVLLLSLPLAGRRRWPLASVTLVSLGFALDQVRAYQTTSAIALPVALFAAGASLGHHRRATVVAASAAYVPLVLALRHQGSTESVAEFVVFYLILAIAWGLGAWLRRTRAAEALHRRHLAESTRAAERTRLARELHDVVTHHVTAMVVQAEAARYVTADPAALDRTLTAVAGTGRRAVADLRAVLELLDPEHGPEQRMPTLGELGELVERTRQAGQPVELAVDGEAAAIAGGAEVAAYRVVQEALTNALKHAPGSRTRVEVRQGAHEIEVAITTASRGARPTVAPRGSGRGLSGLRERVQLLGGDLDAGPDAGGAFVVRARIPAGGAS